MPEKPDGRPNPDSKDLPSKGQEPSVDKRQEGETSADNTAQEKASQRLSETAWSPESRLAVATPSVPSGFPQPEIVSVVEGQVVKPGELTRNWDLTDEQVNELAGNVKQAMDRRSFAGLGGPDPDSAQMARLLEGLKLSDRRAVEMVLSRQSDFRQDLKKLLKEDHYKNMLAILDRPDRVDNLPLDNTQAVFYAHKIVDLLKDFSKEGADTTANLLSTLDRSERQQIEAELTNELKMPFRDWLKRQMPIGHHRVGLNNESIARIEATLDHPDSGTDYKGSLKVLMAGLRDNWSAPKENGVLHVISGMDRKDIIESGIAEELRSSPYLSKTAHRALDITLAGHDKWTLNQQLSRDLAETALHAKNLELFKDAMQSSKAREYFRSIEGARKIDRAFSGIFDGRDREVAHDYAELNDTKLLTDLQMYQYSVSPSTEAITQHLMSATDDEKKLFADGRQLADLRPKETEYEKAANKYYLEVYEALRSASRYNLPQLRDWTGILLEKKPEQYPADPKLQALKQITEDNKNGITGLDAVRHLQEAFKQNPNLANDLNKDQKLKSEFDATLKRVADNAWQSQMGRAMWKEMTDVNNYNPITALTHASERYKRQGELSLNAQKASYENLSKQLLAAGDLSLEQKLFVAGESKLSANDLLLLKPDEKQKLLKGQYSAPIQEAIFGLGSEKEFVRGVLSKQDSQLTQLDNIRGFAVGRGARVEQLEAFFQDLPVAQRKVLADQYFEKYKSLMNEDVLNQVKNPVDKARILQSLRHAKEDATQQLINVQIEQTKHSSGFDALSEAYSPDQRMANKYSRAAESFYRQVKDGLTDKQQEALDKLAPQEKQEIAQALMKYQSSLKKYWSAQKDYARNKEEMAEQLADAALTAGAVVGSIVQPELTPALLARATALSAAGRLGIKQAVMDKDFDTSTASFKKELFKGGLSGLINTTAGLGTGRLITMGKFAGATTNAAEKTVADLSTNQAIKSVLKEDAEQILSGSLQKTTMDKVFGRESACFANAKELAKTIAPKANEEQLAVIGKAIQTHRRQEVVNTLKGKLWHEGDQFVQSITASVAGSAFAELGSTAAGYESPESLWKRLELSSKSAIVGGALFHVGFKAAGSGVQGVGGMLIGKDRDGHIFAGPGTKVITPEGKEIAVGKEAYYFQPGDNIVESQRDTRPKVNAPPFIDIHSPSPHTSQHSPHLEPSFKANVPGKPNKLAMSDMISMSDTASVIVDKYDKIPAEYRRQLFPLSSEYLDFLKEHYHHELKLVKSPEDKQTIGQLIDFVDTVLRLRERSAQTPRKISTKVSKPIDSLSQSKPIGMEAQPLELTSELSSPRPRTSLSAAELHRLSEFFQVKEEHIQRVQSSSTHVIRDAMRFYEKKLATGTAQNKEEIERFLVLLKQAETQRMTYYAQRYPGLRPGIIDSSTSMNLAELGEYKRDVLEPIIRGSKNPQSIELSKQQHQLLTELQAEHLSQNLDENLDKRATSGPIGATQELRLLWQHSLKDMRDSINFIQGTPVPNNLRPARIELIDNRLARIKGLPKPTEPPVQITEDLVVVPWRDGEIISSKNGDVTVNDKVGQNSYTVNNSGQLIECLDRDGVLWHFDYANSTSNEISHAIYKKGGKIVKYDHDGSNLLETSISADGTATPPRVTTITKVVTNSDGSFALHTNGVTQLRHLDGSEEIQTSGRRTIHNAVLEVEEPRFKKNWQDALAEIPRRKKTLNDVLEANELSRKRVARFGKLVSEFESTTKLSSEEKALFYKHLNRILSDKKDNAIPSRTGRADLAEQVLYNATHTRLIAQGVNKTCNVTTVEKRCWARDPVTMAQFAADVAQHGKFITTSGYTLDMTQISHGLRPDIESRSSLRLQRQGQDSDIVIDGQRSWLSQITQLAMVNSAWKLNAPAVTPDGIINPKNVVFDKNENLVGKINMQDAQLLHDDKGDQLRFWPDDNKVYDKDGKLLSVKPEEAIFDFNSDLVGAVNRSKVEPLYNRDNQIVQGRLKPGDVVYDSPDGLAVMRVTQPGEISYGKSGNPSKTADDELVDHERLIINRHNTRSYCKSDHNGEIIAHPIVGAKNLQDISEEFTGKKETFLIRRQEKGATRDYMEDISTTEELEKLIAKWQADKHLPGIIIVHGGRPPFNKAFDPNNAAASLNHEWHVINVWGIENGMVDTTNQWDKADNLKISVEELFQSMVDPVDKYFR